MSMNSKSSFRPSAPYTRRAPSPPTFSVPLAYPLRRIGADGNAEVIIKPAYDKVDASQLTAADLDIITGNLTQVHAKVNQNWKYEQRRDAHRILDYLYLGPNSTIRDHDFLRREGITMIMVARDSRMSSRSLQSLDKAAAEVGVVGHYADSAGLHETINRLPDTIRGINDHLLQVYHAQAVQRDDQGQMTIDPTTFRRGKVLVTCETGNERSAAIVAAYIMAVYGKDTMSVLQFIGIQRFCCVYDDDTKRMLQTWEDILRARSAVARNQLVHVSNISTKAKRGIDDYMDTDEDMDHGIIDEERFIGREPFTPFLDVP